MRIRNNNYIKLEDCVHGGLYKLECRNFYYGVFDEKTKSFIGIRNKFGFLYLFGEYHWDASESFGTAKPIEFIENSGLDSECVTEHVYKEVTEEMINKGEVHPSLKPGKVIPFESKELRDYLERKKIEKYERKQK